MLPHSLDQKMYNLMSILQKMITCKSQAYGQSLSNKNYEFMKIMLVIFVNLNEEAEGFI